MIAVAALVGCFPIIYEIVRADKGLTWTLQPSPPPLSFPGGPYQVEVNISTTGKLPNGTLYTTKGSQVDFSCTSSSRPPPTVEWWFQAPGSRIEFFGNNLTVSCFKLLLMSRNLQGNYTCLARNTLSRRHRKVTTELLVYCA